MRRVCIVGCVWYIEVCCRKIYDSFSIDGRLKWRGSRMILGYGYVWNRFCHFLRINVISMSGIIFFCFEVVMDDKTKCKEMT